MQDRVAASGSPRTGPEESHDHPQPRGRVRSDTPSPSSDDRVAALSDLTAEELCALVHCLRMTPSNTVIGPGFDFLTESDGFKSLWNKVGQAVNTRDDMAIYRKPKVPA